MSFSPESSAPQPPLSPDTKRKITEHIVKEIQKTIELYEHLYIPADELVALQGASFSKQRFFSFQRWIKQLSEERSIPLSYKIKQTSLENDASRVAALYQVLLDLQVGNSIPRELSDRYLERPLAPDEFFLLPEDIPTSNELPSAYDTCTNFCLDAISVDEYRPGRKFKDPNDVSLTDQEELADRKGFEPTDQDLLNLKYAMHEPEKRQAFLASINFDHTGTILPPAKIFDIQAILKQKEKEAKAIGREFNNCLTTQELLEAFDAAGVRPATLKELLAYSKKYWKPREDSNNPLSEEEIAQRADAICVHALGSIFTNVDEFRDIPSLIWADNKRQLDTAYSNEDWRWFNLFLVFRKEPL